ncbi:hypothetical protein [Nocardioides speluncae]|uniref:hypothetical protein n=1 Tax=Nocardioides speluncae TaxID=2670337 RepID=UPI000D694808|nr:hypothetical protein [Nocardioides speluncae]
MTVALLLVSACGPDEREQRRDDDGPLTTDGPMIGGGVVPAPGPVPWVSTYGAFLLCARDKSEIDLERVRLAPSVKPIAVRARIRTVEKSLIASHPAKDELLPLGGWVGEPPAWNEPYAEHAPTLAGTFSDLKGYRVAQRCSDAPEGQEPSHKEGFTELLLTIESGAKGAASPRFFIDYIADGRPYSLEIDWEMVLCGTATRDRCDEAGG